MNDYKDSTNLMIECQKEIDRLQEEKRKEEEILANKRKTMNRITLAVFAVCVAAIIVVIQVIMPKMKYKKMHDYASAVVGNNIYFGSYEQDNDSSNGKEEIEWIVLEKEDNRLLLISKYGLDCQPYNTGNESVTWETCSLRTWLNETFVDEAFSSEEQTFLANTIVTADKNPEYSTNPGIKTNDKIFLLSIQENEKYFTTNQYRRMIPTPYAKKNGANFHYNWGTGYWWLRSPGLESNYAAYIGTDGSVDASGNYVNYDNLCIRPTLWINLEP